MQRGIAHERTAGVDVDTRRGILYSSALGNELLILSLSPAEKGERATGTTMERKIAKKDRAEGGRKEGQQHRRREAYRSVPPFSLRRRRRRFYQLHLPATPCSQLPAFWFAAAVLYSPVNQTSSHRFHPLPCKPTSVLCRSLALSKKKKELSILRCLSTLSIHIFPFCPKGRWGGPKRLAGSTVCRIYIKVGGKIRRRENMCVLPKNGSGSGRLPTEQIER